MTMAMTSNNKFNVSRINESIAEIFILSTFHFNVSSCDSDNLILTADVNLDHFDFDPLLKETRWKCWMKFRAQATDWFLLLFVKASNAFAICFSLLSDMMVVIGESLHRIKDVPVAHLNNSFFSVHFSFCITKSASWKQNNQTATFSLVSPVVTLCPLPAGSLLCLAHFCVGCLSALGWLMCRLPSCV